MESIKEKNVDRLYIDNKEIILVGTAHVSKESAQQVKDIIESEKPDTVSVELCDSRYQTIRQKEQWQKMDIIKVIKEKKAFLLLSNLLLASFQKRIAEKMDVRPGEEMIRAIETADAVGANIYLADRDIRVTLSRTWNSMGLWDKMKMTFQLLLSIVGGLDEISEEDVEKMKQSDILETILSDMGKSFPALRNILIDERDQYLSHKIKNAPGNKIVAVVGAGHVPGIKKYWEQEINITPLEEIPPKGKLAEVLKWLFPIGIVALIVAGFFYGGFDKGADMVIWWILTTGILAGAGALMAFAHPLSILSAVLAAPITSLHPMIAAGWVSGLVEAFSRKPKVIDFENLPDDILTIRGFWKNNITRILLVVVFTNLGCSIGTFIAIPLMVKALH